jgi:antirestriction protein ArdC/predicted RNA methylase
MAKKQTDNPHQMSFDFEDWLASPTPPPPTPKEPSPSPRYRLARRLHELLADGEPLTPRQLSAEATDVFGGTQAEGKWLSKDAYDALEVAVNLHLRERESAAWTGLSPEAAAQKVRDLTGLVQRLPTQTRRDEEMDEFQQFSTPPALAFVANWAANIRPEDIVLEPSAGTGDLAIWSELAGAKLMLNELSERRRELLVDLFPEATVTGENAEQLHNILPRSSVPTLVVMNPPFSATAGRIQGQRKTANGARHLDQALERLADNGRLVAIVGDGMGPDRPAFRAWWQETQARYNVRANIGISGREYAKYGTTFDNRLLVIDKDGPTRASVLVASVESVSELPSLLEAIRHDRPRLRDAEQPTPEPTSSGHPVAPQDSMEPGAGGRGPGAATTRARQGRAGDPNDRGADAPDDAPGGEPRGGDATPDGVGTGGGLPDHAGPRPGPGSGPASGGDRGVTASPVGDAAPIAIPAAIPVAIPIEIGADAEPAEKTELTESVFTAYRPQRLRIPGAHEHPGRLVQSAAMGAVEPPAPTYSPHLPAPVVADGRLSLAQLEAVVYAGQAHSEVLPNGSRKGFFIGDGTGVGKGREISGVILDNLAQGRDKAVWVSFNRGLIEDARRDFAGVGGDPDLLFFQGDTKAGTAIARELGILFTTYSTLRGGEKRQGTDQGGRAGQTRLKQLTDWLGPDFDGVIAFDEAHSMGNAIAVKGGRGERKPSQQAVAGINLQKEVPDARVLYVSATGATEVSNLTYAERLGLWGEDTPFADAKEFIGQVSSGGIAAMELTARDLKALGVYTARSLSYDDVTYERLEYPLSPFEREVYDELAGAWQVVLSNVDEALELTGGGHSPQAKSAAMSQFWGAHQRFFNQVLTALQTPAVIEHMRTQIDAGHAAVVQIVNTNEAAQERIAAAATAQGTALEELDFTPRQQLMDYVRNGFPVVAHEQVKDANGNVRWQPVTDSQDNPVFDRRAVAMRDALLETLTQIRVPENPLDSIINAFGADQVAEITGRGRRFVQTRDEEGNVRVVEERRGKNASRVEAEAFQADKRSVLVFSGAGGTGYSFHADNTAENRRRRIHYILQPGWSAPGAVQGFGRTHRTNQASSPHYVLPTTDLAAQKRFVSSIARRLDQLGALTRGQRQTTSQGLFTAADNLESLYADTALTNLFQDLHNGRTPLSFREVTTQMGLSLIDENGALVQGKIPKVPQFLNRLLSLKTDKQNQVFELFEHRLVEAVEYAKQQGIYDEGLQTLRAQSIVKTRDETVYTHKTGAATRYVELDVTNAIEYLQWDEINAVIQRRGEPEKDLSGWFVSEHGKTKGQVFYMADRGTRINGEGVETHRGVLYGIRKGTHRYVDNAKEIAGGKALRNVGGRLQWVQIARAVSDDEAQRLWREQLAAAPATETRKEAMLVGAILPIWDRVTGSETIYRLQTDAGEQLLGRLLEGRTAKETLRNLGIGDAGVSKLSSRELFAAVQSGQKAVLSNGWEIVRSRVNYEQRFEIRRGAPFSAAEIWILKEQGAFVERINWSQRVFLPVGEEGLTAFERITAAKPVVELFRERSPETGASATAPEPDAVQARGLPSMALPGDAQKDAPGSVTSRDAASLRAEPTAKASKPDPKVPYYEQVAAKLIEQLEAGTAPWQKLWEPGTIHLSHNPVSGTRYRGANAVWLAMQGRGDPRWMTDQQAQVVGAQVRSGEKGTLVQYWKLTDQIPVKDDRGKPLKDAEGNQVYRSVQLDKPKVFSAVVFNAEQIEGLPPPQHKTPDWDRHERAEAVLNASGVEIRYDQTDRAFYRPATDRIHLPTRDRFSSADCFYGTALHEAAHGSGHSSRLDRDLAHPFGSEGYAKEELRAEIASLMIGDRLGIGHDPGQHAAYVDSWIKVLKDDPKEILRAARDADKITDYLLAHEKERLPTNMEKLPQVERPAVQEKAERQPAPRRVRAAGGRDR